MMKEEDENPVLIISDKIDLIRNQKVMLDCDLASLYGVETKRLKEAVRRNRERFPEDFMFEMTKEELQNWRSHFASSKKGLRYAPFCFTEQGVAMLSSVLKSKKAIEVNIMIIRVFTKMRKHIVDTQNLKLDVEIVKNKLSNHSKNIELVFNYLDELIDKQDDKIDRIEIGYKKKRV